MQFSSSSDSWSSGALSRSTIGWIAVGLLLLGVVAWVAYSYLGWVLFGLFTYYVGRPITRRLSRWISSRSLAAGLTLTFIIVPILLFIAAFLSVALGQALTFLSSDAVATVVANLPISTTGLPEDPVELVVALSQSTDVSSALGQFGVAVGAFAATLFNVFLMLLFAFFLLIEDQKLSRWFQTNVLGTDSLATDYLRRVDRGLTSVFFGYTLTIFVIIVLAAIIYSVFNFLSPANLDIPSVMLLAVVTGVFTLIPLVGRSVVYAFIVGILAIDALQINPALLWIPIVFFLLMVLVFDNVVRTYIRPYLSGKTYDMGLVMFAYLVGPALFGWYGIFMGPLVMVVVVEFIVNVLPRFANVEPEEGDSVDDEPLDHELGGGAVEYDESPDSEGGVSPS
ncbi:AI-2E family transporter [Haloferax sp. MBLA0076]|uniref:AI-2E family transporter n=1 Tax=Haloferax litoreum TaxID=2666140 RepID=A0A6A8GLZ4_9EURY|nr:MULTISPECIES: AI-2E family transporter [Haloferax]KAB1190575.1 AI-2E family transporter [Haloferax sp. CBA1148]MRX23562.1 AI-2E family transporter [Haloferax litoreum]